jgi:hypothetical protein
VRNAELVAIITRALLRTMVLHRYTEMNTGNRKRLSRLSGVAEDQWGLVTSDQAKPVDVPPQQLARDAGAETSSVWLMGSTGLGVRRNQIISS